MERPLLVQNILVRKSGFFLIEALFSTGILALLLLASVSVIRPVWRSYKRTRVISAMYRVEQQIRGQFLESSKYSDRSNFVITIGSKTVAQHGKTLFLNEDFTSGSSLADSDISVKLELVDYVDPISSVAHVGIVYQIQAGLGMSLNPLGIQTWHNSADLGLFLSEQVAQNKRLSAEWIDVPDSVAFTNTVDCASGGFLRGIGRNKLPICWTFQQMRCPAWSVPIGYELVDNTSTIRLKCQKLKNVTCQDLSIDTLAGQNFKLKNLYALSTIHLSELFSSEGALHSKCSLIVDFKKYEASGVIPAEIVNDLSINTKGGNCPDSILFTKDIAGQCKPNFDINKVEVESEASYANK